MSGYGTISISKESFELHDYRLLEKVFNSFREIRCCFKPQKNCFEYYGYSELFDDDSSCPRYYIIEQGDEVKYIKEVIVR